MPFVSDENAKTVVNKVGVLKELNKGRKLLFFRFRIEVSVTNPLPIEFFQPRGDGEELWIQLKFENAPLFCYFSGLIGHDQTSCVGSRQIIISLTGRKAWKESCFQVVSLISASLVEEIAQALKGCSIKSTLGGSDESEPVAELA